MRRSWNHKNTIVRLPLRHELAEAKPLKFGLMAWFQVFLVCVVFLVFAVIGGMG